MRFPKALAGMAVVLAGCTMSVPTPSGPTEPVPAVKPQVGEVAELPRSARAMARAFIDVVERLEPVAERECRFRAPRLNCDFQIQVDDRPGQPANAFQTVDDTGRPVIAFTIALIADARNIDEIAFVMAHEAAHHIENHLARQQRNATIGATVLGELAVEFGRSPDSVRRVQELGAAVGARSFSKDYELEADRLGTIIAARAGYDPVRGAEFFFRVPDPGDRFLGTHPPNAERVQMVLQTAAGL